MKFFSKGNLPKVLEKAIALLPIKSAALGIVETFELSTVYGVGFLEDFVVYSRIPAKYWHNASPGQRNMTVVNSSVFNSMIYNVINYSDNSSMYISNATNGTVSSGTAMTVPSITVQNISSDENSDNVYDGDAARLPLSEASEAIEAGVLPEKALVTPKQVFHELERVQNIFSLLDIEKKITLYKSMCSLIRNGGNGGIKSTLDDIHTRLCARLKYRNDKKIRGFYDQFQNTTDMAIQALLEKHSHLRIGPADDFIPEMPEDALKLMLEYAKHTLEITGKKPVFYLIAGDADFKRKQCANQKRDPILLVQAPFGFYWQILGAWDEEMQHVQEL